ncbi:MAG: DUF2608 domain-containing protein [Puniceicoccales bacterium]|jgi:hypothetical protein|nr:DUF2608 domain-containing protein [Puniceicoccales bacterium]
MMVSAKTIDDIRRALRGADCDTLVAFDCDEVLTTILEHACKGHSNRFFTEWCSRNATSCAERGIFDVATFILVSSENRLVDEKMPGIVKNLLEKKAKAVVLTALSTKPVADVHDPIAWRVATLNRLGYNFGDFWPSLADRRFDEFACEYPPAYSSGVICCGDVPKGEALLAFLKHSGAAPKKIIFIDDKMENLENVSAVCADVGIAFVGVEYVEADQMASNVHFSEKRIEFQLSTLREKRIWISDLEAEEHMSSANAIENIPYAAIEKLRKSPRTSAVSVP